MKKFKIIILTLFLFSLSVFFIAQLGLTQETWRERREERREEVKERIREKLIEKKREELSRQKEGDGGRMSRKGRSSRLSMKIKSMVFPSITRRST